MMPLSEAIYRADRSGTPLSTDKNSSYHFSCMQDARLRRGRGDVPGLNTRSYMSIREAILDEAVLSLARGGEASLRVHDIARSAGCSVSALYVHFGSREGLTEAALIERFRRLTTQVGGSFIEQLQRAKSPTALKRAITIHVAELCAPEHAPVHLARAELVAAARTRPAVQAVLSETELERHTALRDALGGVRDRGLVRRDLNLDAVAALLRSHSMSQALFMSDGNGAGDSWPKVLSRSIEGLLAT